MAIQQITPKLSSWNSMFVFLSFVDQEFQKGLVRQFMSKPPVSASTVTSSRTTCCVSWDAWQLILALLAAQQGRWWVSPVVCPGDLWFSLGGVLIPRGSIPRPDIFVSWGWRNKFPQTGGLKQQELIYSQHWRVDVENPSVGGAMLPLEAPGKSPSCLFLPSGGFQQWAFLRL